MITHTHGGPVRHVVWDNPFPCIDLLCRQCSTLDLKRSDHGLETKVEGNPFRRPAVPGRGKVYSRNSNVHGDVAQ